MERPVVAVRRTSLLSRLVRAVVLWLYRRKGWRLEGAAPPGPKSVLLGVPHTSNWDFVFFLGATDHFGLRPRFMGKDSLFRWPMRRFMFDMGGVPVDRSAKGDYVRAMVEAFAAQDEFHLVVAPEGTRSASRPWRSGFYHIALGAGVPIVCAWVDNGRMAGGIGEVIWPSGDFAADMAKIRAFYETVIPGHPRLALIEAPEEIT